jgi:hypothetical protein
MLSEFANDILIDHLYPGKSVLLEQWHFGNLAFAMKRSPETYRQYLRAIQRYRLPDKTLCILLRSEINLLIKRSSSSISGPILEEALLAWEASLSEVVETLGLRPISVDSNSIDDAIRSVSQLFPEAKLQ